MRKWLKGFRKDFMRAFDHFHSRNKRKGFFLRDCAAMCRFFIEWRKKRHGPIPAAWFHAPIESNSAKDEDI